MLPGESNALPAIQSCFGGGDFVVLRRDGDGALLVRDEHRYIEVVRCSSSLGISHLMVPPWGSKSFAVRVGNVLYDSGPIELEIGDEIQIVAGGGWSDECGLRFRVESVKAETMKSGAVEQPNSLKYDGETSKPTPSLSDPSGDKNDWRLFMTHRLACVNKVFSSWLKATSPPACVPV